MKGIIGFIAGTVVGGVTGYIIANKRLKKIYNNELTKQVNDIKATNEALIKRKENKPPIAVTKKPEAPKVEAKPDKNPYAYASQTKEEVYASYSKVQQQKSEEKTDESDEEDYGGEDDDIGELEEEEPENPYEGLQEILKKEGRPYNITAYEFEKRNGFDKVEVTYNVSNELVTDDRTGMTLEDGWRDCGGDSSCLDDDKCYEDGYWYVRNEHISTDFRVDIVSVV